MYIERHISMDRYIECIYLYVHISLSTYKYMYRYLSG